MLTHEIDIDLSQFELKNTLNPQIWNEYKEGSFLKEGVRDSLLRIAKAFWDSLGFDAEDISDILLVGSSCNFNWSEASDLDLHIEVNYSSIDDNVTLMEDYFKTKSREWNSNHPNLNISGIKVEVFVQDIGGCCSCAKYSILHDKWLVEPRHLDEGLHTLKRKDKEFIKKKSALIMGIIDGIVKQFNKNIEDGDYVELYLDIQDLLSKLTSMRKKALKRGGEMDKNNIVYKVLRRSEHLTTLWELNDKCFDKIYSH